MTLPSFPFWTVLQNLQLLLKLKRLVRKIQVWKSMYKTFNYRAHFLFFRIQHHTFPRQCNQLSLTFRNMSLPLDEDEEFFGGSIWLLLLIRRALFLPSILTPWSSSCWFSSSFRMRSRFSSCWSFIWLFALAVGGLVSSTRSLQINFRTIRTMMLATFFGPLPFWSWMVRCFIQGFGVFLLIHRIHRLVWKVLHHAKWHVIGRLRLLLPLIGWTCHCRVMSHRTLDYSRRVTVRWITWRPVQEWGVFHFNWKYTKGRCWRWKKMQKAEGNFYIGENHDKSLRKTFHSGETYLGVGVETGVRLCLELGRAVSGQGGSKSHVVVGKSSDGKSFSRNSDVKFVPDEAVWIRLAVDAEEEGGPESPMEGGPLRVGVPTPFTILLIMGPPIPPPGSKVSLSLEKRVLLLSKMVLFYCKLDS